MTGQIPPYGVNFRREDVPGWHEELARTAYVLRADPQWFVRAHRGSERWHVYWCFNTGNRDAAIRYGKAQPNMRGAMRLLLDGIRGGFYTLAEGAPPLDDTIVVTLTRRQGRWLAELAAGGSKAYGEALGAGARVAYRKGVPRLIVPPAAAAPLGLAVGTHAGTADGEQDMIVSLAGKLAAAGVETAPLR